MSFTTIQPLKPIKHLRKIMLLIFILLTMLPTIDIAAHLLTDPFVVTGTTTQATIVTASTGFIFHTAAIVQFTDTHGTAHYVSSYDFGAKAIDSRVTIRYETNRPTNIESEDTFETFLSIWLTVTLLLTGACLVLLRAFWKEVHRKKEEAQTL